MFFCGSVLFLAVASVLALAEALRFARSDGLTGKDVQGRLGMALDEMNIMERIDLAPQALTQLGDTEKELAEWVLKNSRQLRHAIGEIKSVSDMEKAAAGAARLREEFMTRYSAKQSYAEECKECGALQDLRVFLQKRRQNK